VERSPLDELSLRALLASNEPDNGLGDGDTANGIQCWIPGTADVSGMFRAERSGKGSPRWLRSDKP
jgi:hypothetical protein